MDAPNTGADRDDVIEALGRAGLVSRGVLWLAIGLLAVRLAVHGHADAGEQPDKKGALVAVARQPGGRLLIGALALGFVAMVVWSVIEVVQRRQGSRGGHWGHRLAAAGRVGVYGALAATTIPAVLSGDEQSAGGKAGGSGGGLAPRAFGWPGGRYLVGAVALGLLAAAVLNVARAVTHRYERHWDRSRMRGASSRIASPIEWLGYVGHGLAFALIGWFLLVAAVRFDPLQPTTLDQSLATLVGRSHGPILCFLVAAGVVAWGLCSFAQAMWRMVPAE